MKQLLVLLFATLSLFTACKKGKDTPSLKGKWHIEAAVTNLYSNGELIKTTSNPAYGVSINFQENGIVVMNFDGNESAPYKVLSASQVEIDKSTFEIVNLTTSSVSLSQRTNHGNGEELEETLNLKR